MSEWPRSRSMIYLARLAHHHSIPVMDHEVDRFLSGMPPERSRLMGRPFHIQGMLQDQFHLTRANDSQRQIVADIFRGKVTDRYTECLFHPDLRLTLTGRSGSAIGRLDARLGDVPLLGRWIARQRSFEAIEV